MPTPTIRPKKAAPKRAPKPNGAAPDSAGVSPGAEGVELIEESAPEQERALAAMRAPGEPDLELLPPDDSEDDEGDAEEVPVLRPRRRPAKRAAVRADAAPDPDEMGFCDFVNTLSATDWETHRIGLYRRSISPEAKKVMKAMNGRTYLDYVSGPFNDTFDEAWIKARYGGGVYALYLQQQTPGAKRWDAVREFEMNIEGAPRYTDEERAALRTSGVMPASDPAAPAGGGDASRDPLINLLQRQIEKSDAPQAEVIKAMIETMRQGQMLTLEMITDAAKRLNEKGSGAGETMELLKIFLPLLMQRSDAVAPREKSTLQQLREMEEIRQLLRREDRPRNEPGPFDEVAKALMTRATENIVGGSPDGAIASRPNPGGGWVESIIGALVPKLPELVGAVVNLMQMTHKQSMERLQAEAAFRSRLIAQQKGDAAPLEIPAPAGPPVLGAPAAAPAPGAPVTDPNQQLVQQEQQRRAVQLQMFSETLTRLYFEHNSADVVGDALLDGFPQVVAGLRKDLAPHGAWWQNPLVMAHLRNNIPDLRAVLNDDGFPEFAAQLWVHFGESDAPEGAAAPE